MTQQLRPGREPVDMSPEAIAERRKAVLQQLRDSNAKQLRRLRGQPEPEPGDKDGTQ